MAASGDTIGVGSDVTTGVVAGNGDVVNITAGDTFGVTGTVERLNASDATIDLGANTSVTVSSGGGDAFGISNGDTLAASGDTIDVGNYVTSFGLAGNSDTINITTGDTIGLAGTGDALNCSGVTIGLGANSSVMVRSGYGDTIEVGANGDFVAASSNTIGVGLYIVVWPYRQRRCSQHQLGRHHRPGRHLGHAERLGRHDRSGDQLLDHGQFRQWRYDRRREQWRLGLTGTNDGVTGSSDAFSLAANQSDNITGNNDTIGLGSGDTLGLTGIGDGVSASTGTIVFGTGAQAVISGNSNTIDLSAWAVAVVAAGSGDAVNVASGANADENVYFADGTWQDQAFNPNGAVAQTTIDLNAQSQITQEDIFWNPGHADSSTTWLFDTTSAELAAVYDRQADGSYTYTEFNTSHTVRLAQASIR